MNVTYSRSLTRCVDAKWLLHMAETTFPHTLHCIDVEAHVGLALKSTEHHDWRLSLEEKRTKKPIVLLLRGLNTVFELMNLEQTTDHALHHKAYRFIREVVDYSFQADVSVCAELTGSSALPLDFQALFIQTATIDTLQEAETDSIITFLLLHNYTSEVAKEFTEANELVFQHLRAVCVGRSISSVSIIIDRSAMVCFDRLYRKLWLSMLHFIEDLSFASIPLSQASSVWRELSKEDIDSVISALPLLNEKKSSKVIPTHWDDIGGIDE